MSRRSARSSAPRSVRADGARSPNRPWTTSHGSPAMASGSIPIPSARTARARFGGPVAHGNLTLAMIDGFREELVDWSGFRLDINCGFNKVRFPAPVPVGSRLRATLELLRIDRVAVGWQILQRVTVEIGGATNGLRRRECRHPHCLASRANTWALAPEHA